ncbi:MAG: hypothetical protein ABUT20_45790 [Bacteroidota bacterium]
MKPIKNLSSLILLSGYLLLIVSTGCKKDTPTNPTDTDTPGNYYIKFKAGGVQKSYENDAVSLFNASSSDTLFSTIMGGGLTANTNTKDYFAILLGTRDPAVAGGRYVDFSPAPAGYTEAEAMVLTYVDANGKQFGEIGDAITYLLYEVHSESRVEITELTTDYAKGTFSGLLFDPNTSGTSAARINVTEGKFYLKRAQ